MSRQVRTPQKRAKSKKDRVLDLVRQAGVLRPRDLDAEDISREYLRRFLAEGLLDRPGRGIHVAVEPRPIPHHYHRLAEACKPVPRGMSACWPPSNSTN